MAGSNPFVLNEVRRWLQHGYPVWLATVVQTWGSSPRPAGSLMAFSPEHGIVGSISGGCLEEDLLRRSIEGDLSQSDQLCHMIDYGITSDDRNRFTLPCGGQLRVLVERLSHSVETFGHFDALINRLEQRHAALREVDLATGSMRVAPVDKVEPLQCEGERLLHWLGPRHRLVMIGAGEVARCLGSMALDCDFDVVLVDSREHFLQGWHVEGVEAILGFPDDVIRARFDDRFTAIVTLAHDPRVDDMALLEAVTSQAFYLGAMGSLKTSAGRRSRLRELGVEEQQIARIRAPIGIDIGSKTPAEIAVSILGQLIQERKRLA